MHSHRFGGAACERAATPDEDGDGDDDDDAQAQIIEKL